MNTTQEITKDQVRELAIRDRHHEALALMKQMPSEVIQSDEDLAFWHALCLLSTVRYVEGKQATEEYIRSYATPDNPLGIGRSYLLRSHLSIMDGNTEASYELEQQVIANLPETAYHELLRSWSTIDTMAGHMGDTEMMERAIEALADVRNHLPFDQSWWYSFVVPNRADILAKRGFLEEAEKFLMAQLPSMPEDDVEIVRLRLAVIALEQQHPEKAADWLKLVSHDGPTTYWTTEAFLIAAQVRRLLGDAEGAIKILQEGMEEHSRNHVRAEYFRAQIQLCELWIQEGEIELAEAWVSLASKSLDPWPRTFGQPIPAFILAQLEIAKGNWSAAIELLEALQEEGERRKHGGLLVGIYAHLSYAYAMGGDSNTSVEFANRATSAGSNGNFVKSYTVFGLDVRRFLTASPEKLIQQRARHTSTPARTLLSLREMEVLNLVEAGKRNSEIAETLYLSTSTVKNHLANIFKRLGVTNRRDAVYVARQMGILTERDSH